MSGGISDWVSRRAIRSGTAVALIAGDTGESVSYAELSRRVSELAGGLRTHGIRRGDRVALLMENSIEFIAVLLAVSSLGAVVVPLNYRLSATEVAFILKDSGALMLVATGSYTELAGAALRSGEHAVRWVVDVPDLRDDKVTGVRPTSLRELPAGEFRGPDPGIRDDDVCIVMYTSGTTGRPKGAMLTHGNMFWNAINNVTTGAGCSSTTRSIAVAPMFHIGALGLSVLPVLYAGGTVITTRSFNPVQVLKLIERYRVTSLFMVPSMWAEVSQVPNFAGFDTSSMQMALSGGAPCPMPVIEFFQRHGWTFTEGFGMTEASPGVLFLDGESIASHAGSVGRPYMHVDVRVVDENDHEVAPGEVGELLVRGPNVFAGYWGLPEETAMAMRGGWFHSGDLARQDPEGYVTLVDRKKDMIISGGENVYPIEVEQVLHRHQKIMDVAVIGLPDEHWGETVLAVVVPNMADVPTEEEIRQFCRAQIGHFKCPRRVELVAELPRNATGKVLKRDLRNRFGSRDPGSVVD